MKLFLHNFLKGDKIIWIIFIILCAISFIEVFSASSLLTFKSGDHLRPIGTHFTLLMAGVALAWVIHNIPCRWFNRMILLYPIAIGMLLAVLFIGATTNSARRWLEIAGIQFQPSELGKMATIVVVAFILSRFREGEYANRKAMKFILWTTVPMCALIFPENLSTALLLAVSVYLMMFVGRIPTKQMLKLTAVCIIGGALATTAMMTVPDNGWEKIGLKRVSTWKSRITKLVDQTEIPAAKYDLENDGQVAYANIAIATSNILGKGPGNSIQRDFLPQAFSDFIYAIIIEELGLFPAAIIAFLYIALLIRIGRIANQCDKPFYIFLITGIGILMVGQALFHMLIAVGIGPVTGQPLPLISKGGTSMLINSIYIGIILSISRYVKEQKDKQQAEEAEKQAQVQEAAITLLRNAANSLASEKETTNSFERNTETSSPKDAEEKE